MKNYQKKLIHYHNLLSTFSRKKDILKKIGKGIGISAGITGAGLIGYNKGWRVGNAEGINNGQELIQDYRKKLTETGNISNEVRNLLVNNRKTLTDEQFNEYYDRIIKEENKLSESIHKNNAAPEMDSLIEAYDGFNEIKTDLLNNI